ncbi:MAG: hypothetical protein U1A77_11945 [Pirellulales bacterium]
MTQPPSRGFFQQRPPSAEESFRKLVREPSLPATKMRRFPISDVSTLEAVSVEETLARETVPQLSFEEIYSSPENQVFKVVFFPDRIFHAQYLNASRTHPRYRYSVSDARSVLDTSVLKAQVFMDGKKLANVLRIEYRASRLVELARESGRFLREEVIAWVQLVGKVTVRDDHGEIVTDDDGTPKLEERTVDRAIKLHFCPWINAYQAEVWSTLEPPSREMRHDFQVLAQMGPTNSITRVRAFSPVLEHINDLNIVDLAFRENDVNQPFGHPINDPRWDNNNERSFQAPNSPIPSNNAANTIPVGNYRVSFQKGWYLDARSVAPVRYRNAMMDENPANPEFKPRNPAESTNWTGSVSATEFASANVIEMRWLLQREFGGSVVFFHEVTIPVGTVEGTHQHIGSEELYYIVEGEGEAYMAVGDDPATAGFPKVNRPVYGLFEKECVALPVKPGNVIFTKSGGIHGIRNTGDKPLRFVAFLYHSV